MRKFIFIFCFLFSCQNYQNALKNDERIIVVLDLNISKFVDDLAGNPTDSLFNIALVHANNDFNVDSSGSGFLELFNSRVLSEEHDSNSLYRFFWRNNSLLFTKNDPVQVKQQLNHIVKDAVFQTKEILKARLENIGVSNFTIESDSILTNRLIVKFPEKYQKNRISKLLKTTASLEFFDCYYNKEWMSIFQVLDEKIFGKNNDFNGKIFNQKLILLHDGSNSPYIGIVENQSDMQVVDSVINSLLGKKTFNFQDVKFLWMKNKSDWFWEGEMINGYALLAIEIPIHGKPKLTGDDIEDAKQSFDMKNNPSVVLRFNPVAAYDWEKWTDEKVNKMIAIVMDDIIYSAPYVRTRITGGKAEISGGFETIDKARDLANIFKLGPLPMDVKIINPNNSNN